MSPLYSVCDSNNWHCAGANGPGDGSQEDHTQVDIHCGVWYDAMQYDEPKTCWSIEM